MNAKVMDMVQLIVSPLSNFHLIPPQNASTSSRTPQPYITSRPSFHPRTRQPSGYNMIDTSSPPLQTPSSGIRNNQTRASTLQFLHSQLRKLLKTMTVSKRYVRRVPDRVSGLEYTYLANRRLFFHGYSFRCPMLAAPERGTRMSTSKKLGVELRGRSTVQYPMMWNAAIEFSFVALDDLACCGCGRAG